ncbi:MAG: hypothetical protein B6I20_03990 [Bacteroidetes bacterium 4572_117]|nr:MAG: hypothetical protein B6I20_03990 [Bacteroidetes bacterium 4572_117]
MRKKLLGLIFIAAFAFAAIFVVSCSETENNEATDGVQTEITDEANDEHAIDDAESHEGHNHDADGHTHDAISEANYQCPMKCEGGKTYTAEGYCPECKMALEAVEITN